jgi:hypothetical protein
MIMLKLVNLMMRAVPGYTQQMMPHGLGAHSGYPQMHYGVFPRPPYKLCAYFDAICLNPWNGGIVKL